jgi:hypothetical protein
MTQSVFCLQKMPKTLPRILQRIESLGHNPRPVGCEKLKRKSKTRRLLKNLTVTAFVITKSMSSLKNNQAFPEMNFRAIMCRPYRT